MSSKASLGRQSQLRVGARFRAVPSEHNAWTRVQLLLGAFLTFCVIACTLGQTCDAAASIRVSPSRVEKQVRRFLFFEDRRLGPIKVVNSGTVPLKVKICVEDLYQSEDGSALFVTDGSYEYGAAGLVSLEPAEFTIEPGKTQLVNGTVDTSSGRRGGGYCVAFFETQPESSGAASMATASRVGALIYIVFPGPVKVDGHIERLEISGESDRKVRVRLLLRNGGDVHICPRGILRLKDSQANLVGDSTISPQNILPSASRWFFGELSLPSDIKPGEYILEATMLLSETSTAYKEATLRVTKDTAGNVEVFPD